MSSPDDMKKSEIIDRSHEFAEPYCITDGKKFRLKDVDPADMGKATSEDKPRAKGIAGNWHSSTCRITGRALRAGPVVGAADLSGDGCRGKRWRDQARYVRR